MTDALFKQEDSIRIPEMFTLSNTRINNLMIILLLLKS